MTPFDPGESKPLGKADTFVDGKLAGDKLAAGLQSPGYIAIAAFAVESWHTCLGCTLAAPEVEVP